MALRVAWLTRVPSPGVVCLGEPNLGGFLSWKKPTSSWFFISFVWVSVVVFLVPRCSLSSPSVSQLENLPVGEELRDGQWRMVTVRAATALLCGTCLQLVLKLPLILSYR